MAIVQRKVGAMPTGIFDEETAARVRGVQLVRRKRATGVVDAGTAEALGESPRVVPEWFIRRLELWFEGPDVLALRARLGLPTNDNRYTPDVEAAVRRYQSEHGLALNGLVDEEMARHIG